MSQILRIMGVVALLVTAVACGDKYTPTEPGEDEPRATVVDSVTVVADSLPQAVN